MEQPSQSELQARLGISQAYASMILRNARNPSRPLAIRIFREFGWRHPVIAELTDAQIDALEAVEPWNAKDRAA